MHCSIASLLSFTIMWGCSSKTPEYIDLSKGEFYVHLYECTFFILWALDRYINCSFVYKISCLTNAIFRRLQVQRRKRCIDTGFSDVQIKMSKSVSTCWESTCKQTFTESMVASHPPTLKHRPTHSFLLINIAGEGKHQRRKYCVKAVIKNSIID